MKVASATKKTTLELVVQPSSVCGSVLLRWVAFPCAKKAPTDRQKQYLRKPEALIRR